MTIYELIKTTRIEKDMTRKELADLAGVTTRSIHYWEAGKNKISLENADKVLKALGKCVQIGGFYEEPEILDFSEQYKKAIADFDKAMDEEDAKKVKEAYTILDEMLHPQSTLRKILKIQMVGMEEE